MDYRREIDGLRALAVVAVILFHAGFQTFSGGFVGVDVFFVISGYLITAIVVAERQAGTFTLAGFYERRARRILPPLFLMLIVSLPFAWFWMLPGEMREFSASLASVSTFASNIFFWRTTGYFDTGLETKPLLHTWSLAVEEQYYLVFPVLLLFVWQRGRQATLLLLAAVACVSLAVADWGVARHPEAAFYLLPTRGWELMVGACVAIWQLQAYPSARPAWLDQALSAAGLAAIIGATVSYSRTTPFPGTYALIPTVGTALVIACGGERTFAGRLLGCKALVGIGLISYGAYLWHQPIFAFARQIGEPSPLLLALLSVAALALAFVSWQYVEKPFRDRSRFSRRQICLYGATCSAAFIAFGIAGMASSGFSYRYPQADRELAEMQFHEAGKYVSRRFNALAMRDFDAEGGRLKVLVIGDSYAQDLVNALYESGFADRLDLSTRHISKGCGNLFLPRSNFARYIDLADRRDCADSGLYEDRDLRALSRKADEIWLVSSWQPWQVAFVPQSVIGLKDFSGKTVRVFGRKNFGNFRIKDLLAKDISERFATRVAVNAETLRTNELLKAALPAGTFVDVQALLCGDAAGECPLFTANGKLITFDGAHLTADGARLYGTRLREQDGFRRLAVGS